MKEEQKIYCKMDDWQQRLLERVSEQRLTNFEPKGDFISIDSLWSMIDELSFALERAEEEIKELENKDDYDEHQDIPEIHGKGISW